MTTKPDQDTYNKHERLSGNKNEREKMNLPYATVNLK